MQAKHLIDWRFWRDEDIRRVLELSRAVKRDRRAYQDRMQGNTLVMLFQK